MREAIVGFGRILSGFARRMLAPFSVQNCSRRFFVAFVLGVRTLIPEVIFFQNLVCRGLFIGVGGGNLYLQIRGQFPGSFKNF